MGLKELKFRVWDDAHKNMIYVTDLYWFKENGIHSADQCELMMFSGIHDKSGREIYEGDIILTNEFHDRPYSKKQKSKRHIGVVEYYIGASDGFFNPESGKWDGYKEFSAEWRVRVDDYGKFGHCYFSAFLDCEVLGNIDRKSVV